MPELLQKDFQGENPQPEKSLNDKDLLLWLDSAFKYGEVARRPFERMAFQCLLWWAGNQAIHVERDLSNIYSSRVIRPEFCERVRRINNQFPTHTRSILAAMTQNRPDFEAKPASNQIDDVEAAQLGTRILRWLDERDEEDELSESSLMWTLGVGETMRRTYWDGKESNEKTEFVNFFRYLKDPQSTDRMMPRWIIEYDARPVDAINAEYGVKVKPEGVADVVRFTDRLAMNVLGGKDMARETPKDSAILKRFYMEPTEKYPNGQQFIWAGGSICEQKDLQDDGMFPWSVEQWFPIPGRLYPLGLLELLMSDQNDLNNLESIMAEALGKKLRGDIITAGTDQDAVERVLDPATGRRQIMLPDGIEKWEIMNYAGIGWQEGKIASDRRIEDIHEKAGQNSPSLGQPVGKQITVGELQILRDSDFQALTWQQRHIVRHARRIRIQKLRLVRRYVQNYRLVDLGGKEEAIAFRGADLRDTKDVIAVPVPHMTPAMQRQLAVQAHGEKWTGPYASPEEELSARMILKNQGMVEVEEQIAEVYGPFDELQAFVREMEGKKKLVLKIQTDMAIQQILNPPAPVGPDGQPIQDAGGMPQGAQPPMMA